MIHEYKVCIINHSDDEHDSTMDKSNMHIIFFISIEWKICIRSEKITIAWMKREVTVTAFALFKTGIKYTDE